MVCTGPITYWGDDQLQRDLLNLKEATKGVSASRCCAGASPQIPKCSANPSMLASVYGRISAIVICTIGASTQNWCSPTSAIAEPARSWPTNVPHTKLVKHSIPSGWSSLHSPAMTVGYYVIDGDDICYLTMAARAKAKAPMRDPRFLPLLLSFLLGSSACGRLL